MAEVTENVQAGSYQVGASRPPLSVGQLPEPEEVFGVSRLGWQQIIKFAIGPSLIALGISIGSGEWLLGPQAVGQYGFIGIGWVITVSAVLQTFYNVEISRYVMATGEAPVVGWGRVPPGYLVWLPISVFIIIFAFIAGGWAAAAGQGVYALVHGEAAPAGAEEPRLWAIALLVLVFVLTALAKRISRSLELANWVMVGTILVFLLVIDLAIVPFEHLVGRDPGLRHAGRPARGHHRHPARRPGRLHRAGVRAQLVRDGPLPRQGLRHGLPHRVHLGPARRAHGASPRSASRSRTTRRTPPAGSAGTGC